MCKLPLYRHHSITWRNTPRPVPTDAVTDAQALRLTLESGGTAVVPQRGPWQRTKMYDFCLTFPYAMLLALGGVAGFATKGSLPSLLGGLGSAVSSLRVRETLPARGPGSVKLEWC